MFHFLTYAKDRTEYVRQVLHAVRPRGYVVVATFGPTGRTGAAACPWSATTPTGLHDEFGAAFRLIDSAAELHRTPAGAVRQSTSCFSAWPPPTVDNTSSGAIKCGVPVDGPARRHNGSAIVHAGGGPAAASFTLSPRGLFAAGLPPGAVDVGTLETLPGKVPLIRRSLRPPNFETPVDLLDSAITPNRAFFVRWHLSKIPEVDSSKWKLKVGGPA